jgi:hypothetical protein
MPELGDWQVALPSCSMCRAVACLGRENSSERLIWIRLPIPAQNAMVALWLRPLGVDAKRERRRRHQHDPE